MTRFSGTTLLLMLTWTFPLSLVVAQERAVPSAAERSSQPITSGIKSSFFEHRWTSRESRPEPPTAFDADPLEERLHELWTQEQKEPPLFELESPDSNDHPVRRGGPGPGGSGGMMGGGPPGYDATWYPTQSVTGQSGSLGLVRQGLRIGAPLWRGDGDMVMASLGIRNTLFSTDAVLPDTGRPFPEELWNVNFGLNYLHQFDNGWSGGLMGGFGSASDQPFDSIDEFTANLGAFLRVPARNERDSWQFMLMYLYGGQIDFPIPMVSYAWNPSDQLRVNIGLPFSIHWEPSEVLTLDLSYMPLNTINALLSYQVAPQFKAYGGYEFLNETYFLTDRADLNDRFFVAEQRLVVGVRWGVWSQSEVDLNAGYSFGRNYGEGDNQWGTLTDQLDVDPGVFLGLSFRMQF